MASKSIVLVIPYFGRWPNWFSFFLESCNYNPDIDWLFYTDCPIPDGKPPNVRFNQLSFDEYKRFVSSRLGIEFNPLSPYKLCDLKPALGYVHAEDTQGYEFWGFSDIDLVYGDLRSYFDDEKLSRYELISTHKRRISGHCCLMRNNEKMRTAFMRIKNWERYLADQKHYAFDEKAFSRLFVRHKNMPALLFKLLAKLNAWSRISYFEEAYTTPNAKLAWKDGSHDFPSCWYWNNGVVSNDHNPGVTYPYFHFFKWKLLWKGKDFIMKNTGKEGCQLSWRLTEEGIEDVSSCSDKVSV